METPNMQTATSVNKISNWDLVNRLSPLQRAIIGVLDLPGPLKKPGTGEVIDMVGRKRNPRSFASISRSLERLARAGLVEVWRPGVRVRGMGYRYALTDEGARLRRTTP